MRSTPRALILTLLLLATALPSAAQGEDGDGEDGDQPAPASATSDDAPAPERVRLEDHVPDRWLREDHDELPIQSPRLLRRLPERCHTRGGYREHCQGERRVPTPSGAPAAVAEQLALGERLTVLLLRFGGALEPWLAEAAPTDDDFMLDFPVEDGRLGRGFGRVRRAELASRPHFGIDIGADRGAPIRAARGGLVVYADDGLTGYGNALMVLHEDDTTTFYAHCQDVAVQPGARIERGDVVAHVGSTGFAEAPHLHFEMRLRGWARDPLAYMRDPRWRRHASHETVPIRRRR